MTMKAKQLTILLMWLTTAFGASAATTDEQTLINEWKDSVRTVFADAYRNKVLVNDSLTMKLHWSIYGPKPADGYALYISLHGSNGRTRSDCIAHRVPFISVREPSPTHGTFISVPRTTPSTVRLS